MNKWMLLVGRMAGGAGFVVVVAAFVLRLSGQWNVGGLQTGTLLQAGLALSVLGCLGYTAALAERP